MYCRGIYKYKIILLSYISNYFDCWKWENINKYQPIQKLLKRRENKLVNSNKYLSLNNTYNLNRRWWMNKNLRMHKTWKENFKISLKININKKKVGRVIIINLESRILLYKLNKNKSWKTTIRNKNLKYLLVPRKT